MLIKSCTVSRPLVLLIMIIFKIVYKISTQHPQPSTELSQVPHRGSVV